MNIRIFKSQDQFKLLIEAYTIYQQLNINYGETEV